jgi:hypothetical protein
MAAKGSPSGQQAERDAWRLTRDLLDFDEDQLAQLSARFESEGNWDGVELVRKWQALSVDERHGVAAHFARKC